MLYILSCWQGRLPCASQRLCCQQKLTKQLATHKIPNQPPNHSVDVVTIQLARSLHRWQQLAAMFCKHASENNGRKRAHTKLTATSHAQLALAKTSATQLSAAHRMPKAPHLHTS
jgi:hypothetical protein